MSMFKVDSGGTHTSIQSFPKSLVVKWNSFRKFRNPTEIQTRQWRSNPKEQVVSINRLEVVKINNGSI